MKIWPFTKNKNKDHAIVSSFARVREDTGRIFQWLEFLYHQNQAQQEKLAELESLQRQLEHLPSTKEQIKEIVDQHYSHENFIERMNHIESKINRLAVSAQSTEPVMKRISHLNSEVKIIEESQKPIIERLRELSDKVQKLEKRKQPAPRQKQASALREKIVKKVARRSKDYIKNLIVSTIKKYGQISALQLREMLVEEQGLCSKSSFYRLLDEVESEGSVQMVSHGREKVYLPASVEKTAET